MRPASIAGFPLPPVVPHLLQRSCLLITLHYIDQICTRLPKFTITSLTVHRFVIASITVSSKALCDVFCTNAHYAKVGGIKTNELNLLEREFLTVIDYRLFVSPSLSLPNTRPTHHVLHCATIIHPSHKSILDLEAISLTLSLVRLSLVHTGAAAVLLCQPRPYTLQGTLQACIRATNARTRSSEPSSRPPTLRSVAGRSRRRGQHCSCLLRLRYPYRRRDY